MAEYIKNTGKERGARVRFILIKFMKKKIYNLLRWSEKYTKTDMVYLVNGGFWLNINQGVTSFSGLVMAIALGNILSPEIYGTYKFVLSVMTLLCIFSLNGMSNAIIRAVAMGAEKTIYDSIRTKMRWSVIGLAISIITSTFYIFAEQN